MGLVIFLRRQVALVFHVVGVFALRLAHPGLD